MVIITTSINVLVEVQLKPESPPVKLRTQTLHISAAAEVPGLFPASIRTRLKSLNDRTALATTRKNNRGTTSGTTTEARRCRLEVLLR